MASIEQVGFGFTFEQQAKALSDYFQSTLAKTANPAYKLEEYLSEFVEHAKEYLIAEFERHHGMKVWIVLRAVYEKPLGAEGPHDPMNLSAKSFTIQTQAEIPAKLLQMASELKVRNENLLRLQSFLNLIEIVGAEIQLAEHNPLTPAGHIEIFLYS